MAALLLTIVGLMIGVLWCLAPFALFGVRSRLSRIETAYRRSADEIVAEIQRLNATLAAEGDRLFPDPKMSDRTLLVRQGPYTGHA